MKGSENGRKKGGKNARKKGRKKEMKEGGNEERRKREYWNLREGQDNDLWL